MKVKMISRKPMGVLPTAEQDHALRTMGVSDAELQLWKAISAGEVGGDTISSSFLPEHCTECGDHQKMKDSEMVEEVVSSQ